MCGRLKPAAIWKAPPVIYQIEERGAVEGAGLKPEYHFSPVPHHIAVEKFEHGLFLRDRLITGDGSGDDHIATIVEGEQQVWKPLVAVLLEIPRG